MKSAALSIGLPGDGVRVNKARPRVAERVIAARPETVPTHIAPARSSAIDQIIRSGSPSSVP